jgi:class 3 adenylate cyclase
VDALPQGTLTFLFTDVEGSTNLRTRRGDAPAHTRLRAQVDVIRKEIQERGGHEVKTMGDGFMVAFASARAAVDCAVGIQRGLEQDNCAHQPDEAVRHRIGLHTGEATRQEGDYFGEAVNAAARIMAKGKGGQILLSETVRGVLGQGRDQELLDRGRFRLKGFPERWHLYEVVWQQEAAPIAAPALAERTPFVGREEERAELRRLMEQAIAGQGSIVLIRGEPGVGKTRLAQELVLEARTRGMADQIGRCYEMEGAPPYIPYIEMMQSAMRADPAAFRAAMGENAGELAKILPELRRAYDDIPPPLEMPPEQERLYLFNSMREFLERVTSVAPVLLVLDDLHWADDATLELAQHIAQHQHKMALLTVITYRDIELDAARPFARTLESFLRERLAHRIALKPLPQKSVAAMLQALTGQPAPEALVEAIYRETEGNPFFVEEVFQHLSEQGRLLDAEGRWRTDLEVSELDVPEGVRLVISRRLERVSEACRGVLTDAAVVGRDFTFDLLERLSDVDPDALLDAIDEAERANLIVAADEGSVPAAVSGGAPARSMEARFRFAHELIRQTLISGLSLPRRQRLHLRVAETMELVYGKDAEVYAADMAHHLYQAGAGADPAKTARYLVLAGDRALEGAAFGEALRDYERAFSLLPSGDRAMRADLLYKRGLARRSLDDWEGALVDWREAADAFEGLGDKEGAARTFDGMCYQLSWGARVYDVAEISQRGLALVGRRDSYFTCRLIGWGAIALLAGGYYEAGRAMERRAIAMAERIGDAALLGAELLTTFTRHLAFMELRDCVEPQRRAGALLRESGNVWDLVSALNFYHNMLVSLGRFDESEAAWREAAPLAERLGHLVGPRDGNSVPRLLRSGDIAAFEQGRRAALERGLSLGSENATFTSQWHGYVGLACFWRGQWRYALDSFEEAAGTTPASAFQGNSVALTMLGRAYTGDRLGALAILEQGAEALERRDESAAPGSLLMPMSRAARASGLGFRGVVSLIRESRAMRTRGPLPRAGRPNTWGSWSMLFCAVEALVVLGELPEAGKLYPLVLEGMKTGTLLRYDFRLLDTVAGIAAGAGGKWAEAEEHFQTALRRCDELPHVIEAPDARRWYAWMLLARNSSGDRDRGRGLLVEAIEMYRRLGMPKHIELAETLLREANKALP